MKAIVIGASTSGKTTLIRYLRTNSNLPILEIDEELVRLNNGEFPKDNDYKHMVLAPKIINDVLSRDNLLFFTNTNYLSHEDLKNAREKGFQIIQLHLNLQQLHGRNKARVEKEKYPDIGMWLAGMVQYQSQIREESLVDQVINADQPTEKLAQELIALLN